MGDDHLEVNLANWEDRVGVHTGPGGYDLHRYYEDPSAISSVFAHDAPYLGDLTGKNAVHLQCHIGTDTLSLARHTGATVTGLDFSPSALAVAERLADEAGPPVRYVLAELYDAPEVLSGERYDLVYTGVGALNWLPDIRRWAMVVAELLAPGGRLYLREGHPVLNALDDERDDQLLVVAHPYFEWGGPQRWNCPSSYTGDGTLEHSTTIEWSHGLGEVVQAVIDAGLTITALREETELEWAFFDWMERTFDGRYVLPEGRERLPLMYTLEAVANRRAP